MLSFFCSFLSKKLNFRYLIVFALAVVFTLFYVSKSEKIGRLSSVPNYDDFSYMAVAELRGFLWRKEGLLALWKNVSQHIHSPYSEGLAMVAFALFGHNDRAPYLANGIVVLAYLSVFSWFLRGMSFVSWLASLLIFSSLPIVKMGVVEFRPDIFWGICTALGAIYVLISPHLLRGRREALFSGIIFAAAYLVKPSTFALTTVVLLASFSGRLLHAWLTNRAEEMTLRKVIQSVIIVGCVLLTLAGWYYLFFGKNVWNYFYQVCFGVHKNVWAFQGNWISAIGFYLWSEAPIPSTLGTIGQVMLCIMLGLLVWNIIIGSRTEKLFYVLLIGIGILIYVIITMGSTKSLFLGSSWYMFTIFSTAYLLNRIYLQSSSFLRSIITGNLIIFGLITVLFFQSWPEYSNWEKGYAGETKNTCREATESFVETIQPLQISAKSILFVQSGPVVPEAAQIDLLRRDQNFQITSCAFASTMDEFYSRQKDVGIIVVPDLNAKGGSSFLPVVSILPGILKELASDPLFFLYHTIQTTDGSLVYVYVRKECLVIEANEKKLS